MNNPNNQIRIEILTHRSQERIAVFFPYNEEIVYRCKLIPGARWSATHKVWHFPVTEEVKQNLKEVFPELEIENIRKQEPFQLPEYQEKGQVVLEIFPKKIIVRMAKNEQDIKFIKSLRFSRWDGKYGFWQVSNYGTNLNQLIGYFGERIISSNVIQTEVKSGGNLDAEVQKGQCTLIKIRRMLRVILEFHPVISSFIKDIPLSYWDNENKWWVVPFRKDILGAIKDKCALEGITTQFEEESVRVQKIDSNTAGFRKCPDAMIEKLRTLRYADSTIKTYCGCFEAFINFYPNLDFRSI